MAAQNLSSFFTRISDQRSYTTVYNSGKNKPVTLINFIKMLIYDWISVSNTTIDYDGEDEEPKAKQLCKRTSKKYWLDNFDKRRCGHIPIISPLSKVNELGQTVDIDNRSECRVCDMRVMSKCKECDVTLCIVQTETVMRNGIQLSILSQPNQLRSL